MKRSSLMKGKRYERLRNETELTHDQQIEELKIAQEKEVQSMKDKHEDYLESARMKFEAEKMKLES